MALPRARKQNQHNRFSPIKRHTHAAPSEHSVQLAQSGIALAAQRIGRSSHHNGKTHPRMNDQGRNICERKLIAPKLFVGLEYPTSVESHQTDAKKSHQLKVDRFRLRHPVAEQERCGPR